MTTMTTKGQATTGPATTEQPTAEQVTKATTQRAVNVPEVLTEEHHEAIKASWELPTYEREARPRARSTKPLVVGILVGAVSLAVGFGAGYWAHSQTVETPAPIVISRVAGPVDANGAPLGRRVAPFDTMPPTALPVVGPVDANGMTLGRRVAPFDTMPPTELPVQAATDANGMTLGRRLAPIE
jgi:hypothetical protein